MSDDGLTVDTARINDWETATEVAASISSAGSGAVWALGDICNHVASIRRMDQKKRVRTLRTFAASINQPYETLRTAARTARYVPPALRRSYPRLTFGHFREIVRKGHTNLDDITQWAERATNNAWGVGALKDHMHGMETDSPVRLVRRLNNMLPAIHEESVLGVPTTELLLLRENCSRIWKLLESVAAERHADLPAPAVARPVVRDGAGLSREDGPPATPRVLSE